MPINTPIVGTDEEGEFSQVVLKNKYELDYNLAKQDILNKIRGSDAIVVSMLIRIIG